MTLHTIGLNAALREQMFDKRGENKQERANTILYYIVYYEGKCFCFFIHAESDK